MITLFLQVLWQFSSYTGDLLLGASLLITVKLSRDVAATVRCLFSFGFELIVYNPRCTYCWLCPDGSRFPVHLCSCFMIHLVPLCTCSDPGTFSHQAQPQ